MSCLQKIWSREGWAGLLATFCYIMGRVPTSTDPWNQSPPPPQSCLQRTHCPPRLNPHLSWFQTVPKESGWQPTLSKNTQAAAVLALPPDSSGPESAPRPHPTQPAKPEWTCPFLASVNQFGQPGHAPVLVSSPVSSSLLP